MDRIDRQHKRETFNNTRPKINFKLTSTLQAMHQSYHNHHSPVATTNTDHTDVIATDLGHKHPVLAPTTTPTHVTTPETPIGDNVIAHISTTTHPNAPKHAGAIPESNTPTTIVTTIGNSDTRRNGTCPRSNDTNSHSNDPTTTGTNTNSNAITHIGGTIGVNTVVHNNHVTELDHNRINTHSNEPKHVGANPEPNTFTHSFAPPLPSVPTPLNTTGLPPEPTTPYRAATTPEPTNDPKGNTHTTHPASNMCRTVQSSPTYATNISSRHCQRKLSKSPPPTTQYHILHRNAPSPSATLLGIPNGHHDINHGFDINLDLRKQVLEPDHHTR
jgi:hypothetical protein